MEFWDLFVLQWHGVLLSAGAFGGVWLSAGAFVAGAVHKYEKEVGHPVVGSCVWSQVAGSKWQ